MIQIQKSIKEAVFGGNISAVKRLVDSGANLEETNQVQATPLIIACATGQFRIAEILIAHGANIFAHDQFGVTAGEKAQNSRIRRDTTEGEALERVITAMKEQGFPFPSPTAAQVLTLAQQGFWPPHPEDVGH